MNLFNAQARADHNFEYMLAGLLGLLIIGPILNTFTPRWSQHAISIMVGVAMAAGASSIAGSAAGRITGCLVGAAFALCGLIAAVFTLPQLQFVAIIGLLLFCLWGIAVSLRQVLTSPVVDLNRIAGAVCVYIMLGLIWAIFYVLIALVMNDAFTGVAGSTLEELWPKLSYYSFVTLTTLGYGDISPQVPLTMSLAYLQAIVGQLYVAILIAGLVGAHLNSRQK